MGATTTTSGTNTAMRGWTCSNALHEVNAASTKLTGPLNLHLAATIK